ncbi:MAG: pyridoxamine 5'-phosphate oxidase family protein [Planctomycetaceae bacterium]
MDFEKTDRNRVRRIPDRGHYDRETIYGILDAGFLCHAGFVVDGQPFVIPTLYGRRGDTIYLHGSAASRMLNYLAGGVPVCLTVTHVDGLVLARSAFHHSMNFRSAVLYGTAVEVTGDEKVQGLFVISEQIIRGRWSEVREPVEKELKATSVLRMNVDSASAKVRTGPPNDDEEDYSLPVWAGVVPIAQTYGAAEPDARLADGIELSRSIQQLTDHRGPGRSGANE